MYTKLAYLVLLLSIPIYTMVQSSSLTQSDMHYEPLTLDKVFTQNHDVVNTIPAKQKSVLVATGDVLLARSVNYKTVTAKDFTWPFQKTKEVLQSADITFINLETPLIENCALTHEGLRFCGDTRNVEGLLFAGVDVVNIANNHMANYGKEGVDSTIATLGKKGLLPTGVAGPVYKKVKDITFAFLGYNEVNFQEGISLADIEKIKNEIDQAKAQADVVVVQFHWGNEYTTKITSKQKALAHLAIDSGADLIIGNHPHWIQPVEMYKDKLVVYAHGNFIFDQEWSTKTKLGVVGKYTFSENRLVDVEFLPVEINDFGQPNFLEGQEKSSILEEMHQQSILLSTPQQ